jgi:hypothetical protein
MSVAKTNQLMLFGYLLFVMRTMHLYSVGKVRTEGVYRNYSALKRYLYHMLEVVLSEFADAVIVLTFMLPQFNAPCRE